MSRATYPNTVLVHAEWRGFTPVGIDYAARVISAANNAKLETEEPPMWVAQNLDELMRCADGAIIMFGGG